MKPSSIRNNHKYMIHNNNCDGDKCTSATGEVRVLPYGGGGNLIVCRACYEHEMKFRKSRNREVYSPFDLPAWQSLSVYGQPSFASFGGQVLRTGQRVAIFTDPYTKLQPEGVATLVRLDHCQGDQGEYWWVRFQGECEDVCRRIVP